MDDAPRPGVQRVQLRGFKSISELDLTLERLVVLIGSNGAGKSNFLSFFRLLNALVDERLAHFVEIEGGANSLLHKGRASTASLAARLDFRSGGGDNAYAVELTAANPDRFVFTHELVAFTPSGGLRRTRDLGQGHRETLLRSAIDAGDVTARTVAWKLDRFRYFHFHDTSDSAPVKSACDVADNHYLRGNAGNLAAYLFLMRNRYPAHYDRVRSLVRRIAPFFEDFVLDPNELNPQKIMLCWREIGSRERFYAHQLSDGTLRFICLATLLLLPPTNTRPEMILIDEPELGLHPFAISLLASLMEEASSWAQIIVSTQSATMIDEVGDPDAVLVVEREDRGSVFRRLDSAALAQWLEEYTLGELWMKNVVGGRPRAIGAKGASEP